MDVDLHYLKKMITFFKFLDRNNEIFYITVSSFEGMVLCITAFRMQKYSTESIQKSSFPLDVF
jgi:hypothetical protein